MTDQALLAALALAAVVVYAWLAPRTHAGAGMVVAIGMQWLGGAVFFVTMFRMAWQLWSS